MLTKQSSNFDKSDTELNLQCTTPCMIHILVRLTPDSKTLVFLALFPHNSDTFLTLFLPHKSNTATACRKINNICSC